MSKAKVMVVEDESIVAIDITQRLEALGYDVTATVSTGEKAVEMAKKTRPDIILMDIVLKGEMDGIETSEEINKFFKVPVVYITAYSDEQTLERAKLTGPFGYIIKPFEDRELHSVIEVALYKHDLEKRLKESDELFKAIMNSLRDILFTVDLEGRFNMVSSYPLENYGLKMDDLIGKTIPEVFGEDKIHLKMMENAFNGESMSYEWSWSNERPFHFHVTLSPLRDFEGKIIGAVGILRDITEESIARKALERETLISRALAELSKKLLMPLSFDEISNSVIETAKTLTGSSYSLVGFFESEGTLRNYFLSKEASEKCHVDGEGSDYLKMGGLWDWVLENKSSLLTNDPSSDPRSGGVPDGHLKLKNFLAAPSLLNQELVGIVAVSGKDGEYRERDLEIIERIADIYAMAINRKIEEDKIRASEEKNRALIEKFLKIVTEVLEEIK